MSALPWRFDNSYARLPEALFSRLPPTPVGAPRLVLFNRDLAQVLGLEPGTGAAIDDLAPLFAGNMVPDGATPIAQAYAGHQFGHFTMLGDGRAIALGEHIAPDGRRFDIQLKGSGPTPYSRRGDGRAALGPMLREYVISEAMHALGIPTTRSLAVVATGEPVLREEVQPGAVLTRVAASHLRVGTFEFAAAHRDAGSLRALVTHAIDRHYPACRAAEAPALALLRAVVDRQAGLLVDWMRVGFVHGVMNTDNMTISGETIDYGPCAFIDAYDPATVFSSIDQGGRYAFGRQPRIAQWNLARFAETLLPLIHDNPDKAVEQAEPELRAFQELYEARWLAMMRRKLGLFGEDAGDAELAADLLAGMQAQGADYTNTFHALSRGEMPAEGLRPWYDRWQARRAQGAMPLEASRDLMRQANPVYIPRNHQVEAALAAAVEGDDLQPLHRLLDVLAQPYAERAGLAAYTEPNPAEPGSYQTFCGT